MGEISEAGDRFSSRTVRMAEERYNGSGNYIIGGQAEITDSGEEMGVIVEAMVIHPTPHTPKVDSGAGITGTEVGRCDFGLSGTGEIYGTQCRDDLE